MCLKNTASKGMQGMAIGLSQRTCFKVKVVRIVTTRKSKSKIISLHGLAVACWRDSALHMCVGRDLVKAMKPPITWSAHNSGPHCRVVDQDVT